VEVVELEGGGNYVLANCHPNESKKKAISFEEIYVNSVNKLTSHVWCCERHEPFRYASPSMLVNNATRADYEIN